MLHTSELHELLQEFPLASAILSSDLIILDCNQAFLALFYRERIEVIGTSLLKLLSIERDPRNPGTIEILQGSLQRVLDTHTVDTVALQGYAPPYSDAAMSGSGSRFWTVVNTPIFDDGKLRAVCHCISLTSPTLPTVTAPENMP